jgi:hypothetical protein
MLPMNSVRRPKRSATLANKRRNEPPAKEEAAESHVISAVVMLSEFPTKDEITVMEPAVIAEIPIAIVQVSTKRTSCVVDLKQSGRVPNPSSVGAVGDSIVAGSFGLLGCELDVPLVSDW